MGYKRKLYTLKWPEGHDLHGLEVTTKGLSLERLFTMAGLLGDLEKADIAAQVEIGKELFGQFARCLIEWNLEDEQDRPVPATAEAIAEQDMGFILSLIMAWMDAVSGVDIPLPAGSPNGQTDPAEAATLSLPMEPLPASLPN